MMYNNNGDNMETKKCPRCGAEMPVEMSFCLHCMERTDGVLEIKRKTEPSYKIIISMAVLVVLMIIVIILLVMVLTGRNNVRTQTQLLTSEISADTTIETTVTEIRSDNFNNIIYENIPSESDDRYTEHDDNYQEIISGNENTVSEPPAVSNDIKETDFEDSFTGRLNNWAGTHIINDTLSFSETGCTFMASVGIDKVNCTVTANAEMTSFKLDIQPVKDYQSYSMSVYLPHIIKETTYFVLGYKISSYIYGDIKDMFINYEADGNFSENNFTCAISTTGHNNGSYPVYISCSLN